MIGRDRRGHRVGLGSDQIRALVHRLDREPPDPARTAELRAALLRAAARAVRDRPACWPLVAGGFFAGALAAAAAVLVAVAPGRTPPSAPVTEMATAAATEMATAAATEAATAAATAPAVLAGPVVERAPAAGPVHRTPIERSAAADFERQVTEDERGVDDVIWLHDGRIRLAVGPLASGDRVRVVAGNGEVEGTSAYQVAVTDERLREVTVTSGAATIRIATHAPVVLAAGQTWTASFDTTEHVLSEPATAATAPTAGPAGSTGHRTAPSPMPR